MDDNSNNNSSKIFIIGATLMLIVSLICNIFFYEEWQFSKAYIVHQSTQSLQSIDALIKDNDGFRTTLAECNAALATVQAKPVPVPLACPPVLPMPACPSVPTVVCPAAPEPSPAVIAPAPIATPIPARIIYRYIHHRIHYRKRVTKPEPICDWNFKNEN